MSKSQERLFNALAKIPRAEDPKLNSVYERISKNFPFAGAAVGQKAGSAGQAHAMDKAPFTGKLVGEDEVDEGLSLESTIKNIVDEGKYIAKIYSDMKTMAKKWVDDFGTLENGFHRNAAGIGHRWIESSYFGKIQNDLYDLTKQASKYAVPLVTFLKDASENRDRKIGFNEIGAKLPGLLGAIGQQLRNKDLVNFAQQWISQRDEYKNYLGELEANTDGEEEPTAKAPKDTSYGQQMSQVEQIVSNVLSKLPKNIAGDIRNAIARAPNKLQALQAELQKRGVKAPMAEAEGEPEGVPHISKELLTHIIQQIGTEGAHAIIKSLEWGDGAAKELLQLIKHDLEQDIGIKESVKQRLDKSCWAGYRKAGTQIKGNTRVNKCVPVSEDIENIMEQLINKILINETVQNNQRRS